MTDFGSWSSTGLHQDTDEAGTPSADGKVAFGYWLNQQFVSRADLDGRLAVLAARITKEVNEIIVASKDDPAKLAVAVAAISKIVVLLLLSCFLIEETVTLVTIQFIVLIMKCTCDVLKALLNKRGEKHPTPSFVS